jgi:hydroxymethylbilane synthase
MPIGAHAVVSNDTIELTAIVLSLDGSRAVRASARGSATAAQHVGATAADQLLAQGAGRILEDAQRTAAAVEGLQP